MEAYGASEVGTITQVVGTGHAFGYLGSLLPGIQLYIQDRETGARLGPGQEGRIMVKSPGMVQGYWRSEEATQQFFCGEEGFAYLGDIGCFNEAGDIYFRSVKE